MEVRCVETNQHGVVRVQLVGGEVEFLYAVPAAPPSSRHWCQDFLFGVSA